MQDNRKTAISSLIGVYGSWVHFGIAMYRVIPISAGPPDHRLFFFFSSNGAVWFLPFNLKLRHIGGSFEFCWFENKPFRLQGWDCFTLWSGLPKTEFP